MSLKDIRKRFEESTKGEWVVGSTGGVEGWNGHYGVKVKAEEGHYDWRITPYHTDWEGYGDGMGVKDAEFTAAAHQDVPAMLDVLEEILALHAWEDEDEKWCRHCSTWGPVSWPCATVRAIQKLDAE